ncbi:MAG: transposase, partial [Acidisphaera sp.]|nr:transposase [Acidisphaera sp.]
MAKHRSHSIEFKRQVAQEFLAGETLHGLAKRHDISRNLIRIWVEKYEAGEFDDDAQAADLMQAYEARIAALERLVGKQALELEFLRGLCTPHRGRKRRSRPQSSALPDVHHTGMRTDGHRTLHVLRSAERSAGRYCSDRSDHRHLQ